MGNTKLIICCIAGILLGYLAPIVLKTDQYVSLMVGLIAGLGVGVLLDEIDKRKTSGEEQDVINEKASEAVRLMEEARAQLEDGITIGGSESSATETESDDAYEEEVSGSDEETDPSALDEEEARKLSEARDLIAAARERMKH